MAKWNGKQSVGRTLLANFAVLSMIWGAFLGACGGGGDAESPLEDRALRTPSLESSRTPSSVTECDPDTQDCALVQVLIYGLAVIHTEKDSDGELTKATVYMPVANSHDVSLAKGVYDEILEWEPVVEEIANAEVLVGFPGAEVKGGPMNGLANLKGSHSVSSLLSTSNIDGALPSPNFGNNLNVSMVIGGGTLETCALVFPDANSKNYAWKIKTKDSMYEQVASEYMVVRYTVLDAEKIEVQVKSADEEEEYEIEPTGGRSVQWGGKGYKKVFDIALRNIMKPSERKSTSSDGNHIRDAFFASSRVTWEIEAIDVLEDAQPTCWRDYFYHFGGEGGGSNRPICPLVGHP